MAAMSDAGPLPASEPDRPLGERLIRWLKLGAITVFCLVAAYLIVRYLLSEWWVTWVSDRVHNGHGRGLRWGFALGLVPALLVIGFLRLAVMRAMHSLRRLQTASSPR